MLRAQFRTRSACYLSVFQCSYYTMYIVSSFIESFNDCVRPRARPRTPPHCKCFAATAAAQAGRPGRASHMHIY